MNERGRAIASGTIVAVVAVTAVLMVVWWWWSGPTPVLLRDHERAREQALAQAVPGPLDGGGEPPAIERVSVGSLAARPRMLRIIDVHGVPVADALVAVAVALPTADVPGGDVEIEFADLPRLRSNSDGTVSLPASQPVRFALARKGTCFGCRAVSFDICEPVPELEIAEDRNLQVRVVGVDGRPRAGVPVTVRWVQFASVRGEWWGRRWLRSDAAGRITVWHAQALDHWHRAEPVVCLAAGVFGAESQEVRVASREPMMDAIDVPCAAYGSVRLRAWSADGMPLPASFACTLEAADGRQSGDQACLTQVAQDGSLVLAPIAVGRRWNMEAGGFRPKVEAGPTSDGAEAVCDLVIEDDARLATVRLLMPDGTPVVAERIVVNENWEQPVLSDSQGRIVLAVADGKEEVLLGTGAPRRKVRLTVPPTAVGAGLVDLGDVQLPESHLLVRGFVSGAGSLERIGHARLDVRGRAATIGTQADADGAFEFWDEQEGTGDVRIDVSADGYDSAGVVVPCGSEDVRIELLPRSRLLVTVLTDDDVPLDFQMVFLRGGSQIPFAEHIRPGSLRCAFEVPTLAPGADELVVEVLRNDGTLLPWQVPASLWRASADGLEATLDLRGKLVTVVVTPRVDGADVGVRAWFVRMADGDGKWSDLGYGRRLAFHVPHGCSGETIVLSPNAFPSRSQIVVGENVLDLPPPATIVVHPEGWPDGVRGKVCLCQRTRAEPLLDELAAAGVLDRDLRPKAPGAESKWFSPRGEASRPTGGEITLPIVCRGRYLLVPWVEGEGGEQPMIDAAVQVDVTTPGQRLDVVLRVDPERVRAAAR